VEQDELRHAPGKGTEPSRFCLGCEYPLDGLPEHRCPECGCQFDPADPRTFRDGPRPSLLKRTLTGLDKSLLAPATPFVLFAVSLLEPLVWLIAYPLALLAAIRCAFRRKWGATALLAALCVSPFGFHAAWGAVDYMHGTARLRYMGLPGTTFHNIDPEYRCERSSGGCVVGVTDGVTNGCYNAAVKSLIRTFGPMRGSYLGPYPTKADCLAALSSATEVALADLTHDRVPLPTQTFVLDTGVGQGLLKRSLWEAAAPNPDYLQSLVADDGPITTAVRQGCLILRIPCGPTTQSANTQDAMIVVIDPQTGRPFAYYGDGGYSHNFPPVYFRK
jgi:hypothetical protein